MVTATARQQRSVAWSGAERSREERRGEERRGEERKGEERSGAIAAVVKDSRGKNCRDDIILLSSPTSPLFSRDSRFHFYHALIRRPAKCNRTPHSGDGRRRDALVCTLDICTSQCIYLSIFHSRSRKRSDKQYRGSNVRKLTVSMM